MALTPLRVIGAVLPVLAMAGLGVGLFFVIQTRGDDGASRVAGSPTDMATFAAPTETPELATPTAEAATPTEPPPTEPAATQPPASPTQDTRVPMGLPTAAQIQLGKDGRYFVADRGDGCTWLEYFRETSPTIGLEVFLRTDCPADFVITFRPETGIVLALISD
jgi:hypothetical protein